MVICSKMIEYFQTQQEGVLSPIEEFILYHIKRLQGFIEREKFDFLPIKYDYDFAHSKEDLTLKQNWKSHRTLVLIFYKFVPELL